MAAGKIHLKLQLDSFFWQCKLVREANGEDRADRALGNHSRRGVTALIGKKFVSTVNCQMVRCEVPGSRLEARSATGGNVFELATKHNSLRRPQKTAKVQFSQLDRAHTLERGRGKECGEFKQFMRP